MASSERLYHGSVRVFSAAFVILGLAILATTLANGGGPISLGTVLGLAFIAVGVARLWVDGFFRGWRGGRGAEDVPARKRPSPRDRTCGGESPADRTRGQSPS